MSNRKIKAEIKDLFEQIDQMYWSPQERQLVERAIALAQEIGDEELEYQARMRLTASASQTGDNDAMLSSFAWCLAKYDSDPRRFPAEPVDGAADLLWQFKWMAGALTRNPVFDLTQIKEILADMESHYRKAGLGLSGVYTARFEHLWRTGQIEEAKQLRTLLAATPQDSHSHCDACGRGNMAEFAFELGEEADALRIVDEIVEGGFSCAEEPEGALGATLVAKLRVGRLEDARVDHSRSYRMSRDNPDRIGIVANNIEFCAITGNEARGLAMVERHIRWLAHDPLDIGGHFSLLLAIGVVLLAVINAGHGDQIVRGASSEDLDVFFPPRDTPWTVAQLEPAVWEAAAKIAAAFDARNQNDYVSSKIAAAKALLAEHYDVPIHSDSFLAAPPPALTEPTTAAEWLRLAITYKVSGMPQEAVMAGQKVLESAASNEQRIKAFGLIASGLTELEQYDEARSALANRIELLRANGQTLNADVQERMGLALFGKIEDADLDTLHQIVKTWDQPPGVELAIVQLTLAAELFGRGPADEQEYEFACDLVRKAVENSVLDTDLHSEALLTFASSPASSWDEAVAACGDLLEQDLPDGLRAATLRTRARFYGAAELYENGVSDADEATRINATLRFHGSTASAAGLAGRLLLDAERPAEAVTRYQYAIREAELVSEGSGHIGLTFGLAQAMMASGHPMEAVELFTEVNNAELENDTAPGERAETLSWLGRAYFDFERYGNAVTCFSDAAELYEEAEQNVDAAGELLRLGRIFRDFEEYEDAETALTKGIELLVENESNPLLLRLLEARGDVRCRSENEAGLADFDQALAIATADDQPWFVADMLDSKARGHAALNQYGLAVAAFLTASDAFKSSDDPFSAARAEFFAAQITKDELEQSQEAVPVMFGALELVKESDREEALDLQNAIILRLGDTLEELGRIIEANEVRSQLRE